MQKSLLQGKQQKVDISSLSPEEKQLFEKYGKVPGNKFASKLQERKFFDSGDWALSKAAGNNTQVGTEIPSPADIPHASPPQNGSPGTSIAGTSPTSVGGLGAGGGLGTSPGKEGMGTSRDDNRTFA